MMPQSVDVKPEALVVVWPEKGQQVYTALDLRKNCQCAHCVSETTGEKILDDSKLPQDITLVSAEPTGAYGVTLGFSDGHSTGIYAYSFLSRL